MKKLYYLLVPLFVLCFVMLSCDKEAIEDKQDVGLIVFNYDQVSTSSKGVQSDSLTSTQPQAIVISIIDDAGNIVLNMEEISLYNMNGNYISKPVAVKKGSYKLTDFIVVNEYGEVLYLTPKESSSKAYLVSDPLPVGFSVSKDQVTNLRVEVIQNQGETPEEYGYSTFSFDVVDVIDFHVAVFTYDDSIQNFQLTGADIIIKKEGSIVYSNTVEPITNIIPLREEEGVYEISVIKEGYQGYSVSLTLDELKEYSKGNPLKIILTDVKPDLKKGLVAYYPFNGNANDESDSSHNATVYGAVLTTDRNMNPNSAYMFDGTDDFINTYSTFDYNYRTVNLWVYPFSIHRYTPYGESVISQDSPLNSYGIVALGFKNGLLRTNAGGSDLSDIYTNSSLSDSTWYNITLVRNGIQTLYYINGELVYTGKSGTVASTYEPNPLFIIGGGRSTSVQFFLGKIDDIAIYNRALSDSEIRLIYNTK